MAIKTTKRFGQHFLRDETIIQRIIEAIDEYAGEHQLIEIGPGDGAITRHLYNRPNYSCVEIDDRCVTHLINQFPKIKNKIINDDFLKVRLNNLINSEAFIAGNFPYNISSQIVFKVIDNRDRIDGVIGMFQKEVADRICNKNGGKSKGILTILTQLYYDTELLFDVNPESFAPPPKVMSSVILMKKSSKYKIDFDEKLFKRLVKAGYSQRRKKLRNTLKNFFSEEQLDMEIMQKRPEHLDVSDFINLAKMATVGE